MRGYPRSVPAGRSRRERHGEATPWRGTPRETMSSPRGKSPYPWRSVSGKAKVCRKMNSDKGGSGHVRSRHQRRGGRLQPLRAHEHVYGFFALRGLGNRFWPPIPPHRFSWSIRALCCLLLAGGGVGCTAPPHRPLPLPSEQLPASAFPPTQVGIASWYGPGFQGRTTASGERFSTHDLTAAHRSLPLGSQVTVTNLANGKSVRVRINDRGPYVRGRAIDLSRGAARRLGLERRGIGRVRITANPSRGTRLRSTARRVATTQVPRRRPQHPPLTTARPALGSVLRSLFPF